MVGCGSIEQIAWCQDSGRAMETATYAVRYLHLKR